MNMLIILSVLLSLPLPVLGQTLTVSRENWSITSTLSQTWVSPDGRMDTQIQVPGNSTALDLWPANSPMSDRDSVAEITLHRYPWQNSTTMERFNISAMVDHTDNGAYRFGVERGGSGQFRDILFCFENVTPGVASCPLKITTSGVFVLNGASYTQISNTGVTQP